MNKLHLGCGLTTPEGWINVDGSLNARLAKTPTLRQVLKVLHLVPDEQVSIPWNAQILIHDVRKALPFQLNSMDAIYASHLLEHLYLAEAKGLLKDCFRVLRPGGVLRIVVPDLRSIAQEYVKQSSLVDQPSEPSTISPADRMNMQLLMRTPEPPSGNPIYRLYTALFDFHSHKWMYDADSLVDYFRWAGFAEVREMSCLESRIDDIEAVEQPERVLNGAGVCVEGTKPTIMVSSAPVRG